MSRVARVLIVAGAILLVVGLAVRQTLPAAEAQQPTGTTGVVPDSAFDSAINQNAQRMIDEGRRIFRYDTFGSEAFWGDQLRLHQAIVGEKLGGVGPGVSPKMALSLGLKEASQTSSRRSKQARATWRIPRRRWCFCERTRLSV